MGTSKKKKSWLKKLNKKYRLVIFNESSYEEALGLTLSRMQVLVVAGVSCIVIIALVTLLIAFTGLREFIPGYPSPNERLLIVRNAQRTDSLIMEIERRNVFINSIQSVLRGETPEHLDSPEENNVTSAQTSQPVVFERSEQDSLFRQEIEREEKFNLSVYQSPKNIPVLENIFFFSPMKGMIVNGFGASQGHYGVDIVAAPGAKVSSVMDGVVTFSGWTVETGYVIQVQHQNNLLSIYKHNERLLKTVGEVVKAGEVIAHVGNSGEFTTGLHLHFELWHNGTPLNPQEYITF